mgnify:CR=1 FL=1
MPRRPSRRYRLLGQGIGEHWGRFPRTRRVARRYHRADLYTKHEINDKAGIKVVKPVRTNKKLAGMPKTNASAHSLILKHAMR